MALHVKFMRVTLSRVIMVAMVAAAVAAQAKPGCPNKCGNVEIPFPFGLIDGCYLDKIFSVDCRNSSKPQWDGSDIDITSISIDAHELHVLQFVAHDCYDLSGAQVRHNSPSLYTGGVFTISKKNKFIALGCNTNAFLTVELVNREEYGTGCMLSCSNSTVRDVVNGSCSGIGCCELEIPHEVTNITSEVDSFESQTKIWSFNRCSYAFVVEQGKFSFSSDYLREFPFELLPLVVDWYVGNETCEEARKKQNFACQGDNSECSDLLQTRVGYRCKCKQGYKGNPYLPDGCQDIDECQDPTLNNCIRRENVCVNTSGNYTCHCPKGHHGDGRKDGDGCAADPLTVFKIVSCVTVSLLVLLVGGSWVYLGFKRRKLIKLKEKFFQENGGSMLQKQLSSHSGSIERAKIFSAEELEKATNHYDESRVVGQGGFGTVYRGVLPDDRVIAIKKSKVIDKSQTEQFINEVIVLTQINHRNVVKLLGCCLETEVPLLVYEFITNGTLHNHIHDKSQSSSFSWEKRLKIAAETARALSYLHCEASMPIIHRDVKSSNILLDDNHTAKVSDFGASRLVPLDYTQLTTLVQGTLGYLDPEYFRTSQLTEKSDVYSFGVVMAELLSGKKALCMYRPEGDRNLAAYFVSAVREDRLLQILDHHVVNECNIEQLKEVVNLARKCLSVRGEDRPTMKEVAMELEGLRITAKHLWGTVDLDTEEAEYLLGAPAHSFSIDAGNGCSSSINTTVGFESAMSNQ